MTIPDNFIFFFFIGFVLGGHLPPSRVLHDKDKQWQNWYGETDGWTETAKERIVFGQIHTYFLILSNFTNESKQ